MPSGSPPSPEMGVLDFSRQARSPMTFLEAHKIVSRFAGGSPLPFLLAMSGSAAQMDIFLRAAAAQRQSSANIRTLPFNTLAQHLHSQPASAETEIFLLLPWDFIPELDWRSGLPAESQDPPTLRQRAQEISSLLRNRSDARLLYVAAPIPPVFPNPTENNALSFWLQNLAASLAAEVLPPEMFSLSSYLANGCPIAGTSLSAVAEAIVERAATLRPEPCKVLVTDFDNVLWDGVIGDDGLEGIACGPEGPGFPHFLYQSLLAKLRREGALLASISRNDREVALLPFRGGHTLLKEEDFVAILCTYGAKSAQMAELARNLNLGLDSFVFVDDNPVELAEMAAALPAVRCVPFPPRAENLPAFFARLALLFARPLVTAEDRERTQMYRRRLEGMAPADLKGADLSSFLRDLRMQLAIHDVTHGDRARAVQLINKTNQFNLNGTRLADAEVAVLLAAGGRLFAASLDDRNGTHGQILACLLNTESAVVSLVMSCRVFQRRVEYAFLTWLAGQPSPPRQFHFVSTDRNHPLREFLSDPAFSSPPSGGLAFDPESFARAHQADLELFSLRGPGGG